MTDKKNLTEQVDILFEGIEVTDDQKGKFAIKLEAVLSEKTRSIEEKLTAKKDEELALATEEVVKTMEEGINKYLEYVVTEWMEENKLAVEGGLKAELTESFMKGLKDLFEGSYVELPEGKEDLFAKLETKLESVTSDLNESIEKITTLTAEIESFQKKEIVAEHSEGLTDTQKEKLSSLVEDVEFTSKDSYDAKVKHIRESFFKKESLNEDGKDTKKIKENADSKDDMKKTRMSAYINAL